MVILKCCIEAKGLLKAQAMITTVIYQRWWEMVQDRDTATTDQEVMYGLSNSDIVDRHEWPKVIHWLQAFSNVILLHLHR